MTKQEENKPWSKILWSASSWTLGGLYLSQLVRFIAHVVIARFLTPADFGIMQIVTVIVQGLQMVSDLGIGANIIQHHQGENISFLRTAWTLQIIRGLLIYGIVLIFSFPLSIIYDAPALTWLLPLAGICIIIDGFTSPEIYVLNRKLIASTIAIVEGTSQIIGVVLMLALAWYWKSVWTLAVSPIVSSLCRTLLSHFWLNGPRMKLTWDTLFVSEILHFGKWILVSSMAGFFASRLDRIILGLYLSKTELGLYGIAASIVGLFTDTVQKISYNVLFPFYSQIKDKTGDLFATTMQGARKKLLLIILIPTIALAIGGQALINFIYPENYHGAGWIVQILAAGASLNFLGLTLTPLLIAFGDSRRFMYIQLCQITTLLISMSILGAYFGTVGLILTVAVAEAANYPILVSQIRRYRVWTPGLDALLAIGSLAIIGIGWSLTHYPLTGALLQKAAS